LKSRMELVLASAFTVAFVWAEFVGRDRPGALQSLRSPMVNIWTWWADTNGLKMKILEVKVEMVNVKMKIVNMVARWGGSVVDASVSIFFFCLFAYFFSTLNSLRVFSRAFTLSTLAVIFAFAVFNVVFSFSLFFTSVSLFSLWMSVFGLFLLYRLSLSLCWS